MTPINLIDGIAERIEGMMKYYRYPESDAPELARPPQVYRQYLPAKKYEGRDAADYPFIVVQLGDVEIVEIAEAAGYPVATVAIVCGGYDDSDDYQGWRIPAGLATHIMMELQQRPEFDQFSLELPLSLNFPEDQPYPQWLALLSTRWRLPSVGREVPTAVYTGMYGETLPQGAGYASAAVIKIIRE